ncbi:colorectal mutant cancer protein [Biomphalaria glabrata]|nr:colorectal mutant cancer protein-like [Biomphalaria glabrata]
MHVARGLVREANLPAALSPSGSIFPMEALGMPTIRKSLLDPVVTRQSHPTRLLQAARETIASYPAGVTTIYSLHGSVQTLEGTVKAGYGAVVRLSGNPESDELRGSYQQKSSLEAELEAMFQALDWVATKLL